MLSLVTSICLKLTISCPYKNLLKWCIDAMALESALATNNGSTCAHKNKKLTFGWYFCSRVLWNVQHMLEQATLNSSKWTAIFHISRRKKVEQMVYVCLDWVSVDILQVFDCDVVENASSIQGKRRNYQLPVVLPLPLLVIVCKDLSNFFLKI